MRLRIRTIDNLPPALRNGSSLRVEDIETGDIVQGVKGIAIICTGRNAPVEVILHIVGMDIDVEALADEMWDAQHVRSTLVERAEKP